MSISDTNGAAETITKKKRPTKKQKKYMEGLANNSAAKMTKSKSKARSSSTTTATAVAGTDVGAGTGAIVDTPAGSLMYEQQKKQEEEDLPSQKARTFLHQFQEGAREFDRRVQRDKKYMIQRAADKLAEILIEDKLSHLVCYVSTYLTKALKPIKGFVTDRYVRKCLPEKYKDPEQSSRTKTGGTTSADTKEKLVEKMERAHDQKGIADYTLEQIDSVTNIEIAKEDWKYQLKRALYFEGVVKAFRKTIEIFNSDTATDKQRNKAMTEFAKTLEELNKEDG